MKLLDLSVLLFTPIFITACVSSPLSGSQTVSASATSNAAHLSNAAVSNPSEPQPPTPKIIVVVNPTLIDPEAEIETSITEVISQFPPAENTAVQVATLPWLRIPMHYEVLLGQHQIWNEVGNVLALNLAKAAFKDATTLELNSTEGLLPQQLISYSGSDGEYYSAQIQSIENKTLSLNTLLQESISASANTWNFYSNGSHPNTYGYQAIADYAVRFLDKKQLNEGTHVLLGDSWFDDGSILERLKVHLPIASFIKSGIGGSTSVAF